jgi:hypothetical protein
MADFSIRSDSVNVEDVMGQIRARIRDKRGVDYTEQEIRELAAVKLETFLDPTKVRSDLLEQYRQLQRDQANPNRDLDEETLFGSSRGWLRRVRRWLRPVLKLFLNPVPLMRASRVDTVRHAELFFELMHNLVVETTRLGIEVKTLKMRVESLSSRLDFDERRSRALEGVVEYRAPAAAQESAPVTTTRKDDEETDAEAAAARNRRRRRRRGRRGGQRGGIEEGAGVGEAGPSPGDDRSPAGASRASEADPAQRTPAEPSPEPRDVTAPERSGEEPPAAPQPTDHVRPHEAASGSGEDPGSHEPGS